MALLFSSKYEDPETWRQAIRGHLPDMDFRVWPDNIGDPEDIEFVLAWRPKPGELRRFPNLKAIFSLGAGVDHLFRDPDLPAGVPIVRLMDPALTRGMTEYVAHWVLHFHRGFHLYADAQRRGEWTWLPPPDSPQSSRVGIMGLGVLGRAAAEALVGLGFDVVGWSRTPKEIAGVTSFAGPEEFLSFLGGSRFLVCLLPLTDETRGVIDRQALAALPPGAFLINPSRGPQVVEQDLLEALESGHIAAAALDVFETEPLPQGHPFWSHPKVVVTPHIASQTNPRFAAAEIAANIRRIESGQAPYPLVDPALGY
jgi:glyoxylate/hydroxypyruvate reductase A